MASKSSLHQYLLLPPKTLAFYQKSSSSHCSNAFHRCSAIGASKIAAVCRNSHRRITHKVKPLVLPLRLWLDKCCNLFVSSLLVLCSLFAVDYSVSGGVVNLNVVVNYPCEDVGSYYHDVKGLEGAALIKKLNSIVSAHRSLPYKKVWDALKILDAADTDNPEASSAIIEIYSLRTVPKQSAGKPEGWNREHLWPRSYGLMDGPSLTDLHNIRPADVNVNSSRGNKYYGECLSMSTHCMRPANREAAKDTETDKERWAPPFQVRGDIARSLMYMAVTYGYDQSDGTPHLKLSDSPSMENNEMGLLSTLLHWNAIDPPSREEQLRNNRICSLYQHNRNPFIDHPEYANLIWKHVSRSSSAVYCLSMEAGINELHYGNRGNI